MKKKYVAPESKLIALNLNESIAISGGVSEVGGMAVLKFYSTHDGCRRLYTERVAVSEHLWAGGEFLDYYNDFMSKVQAQGAYEAYFMCFNGSQNV